jgi:hypothetical protein
MKTALLFLALPLIYSATYARAVESVSYAQLAAAAPGSAAAVQEVPPAAPQCSDDGAVCRWPTSVHGYFDTAQVLGIKDDDASNDYYPFAGKVEVQNNAGDSNSQSETLGLKGGMTSESGHPNLFANGGDTQKLWGEALKDYEALDFPRAYYDIGLIAHLTQDQAVPAHAANINHVITFGDNFEKSIKKDVSVFEKVRARVQAMMLPDMEPWQYYQALQDDTRRQLPGWKDPRSNTLYWPPAPGAPPLGQDSTNGPWSHYSNGKDTYDLGVSPQIMERQVLMASAYTAGVLKAAARRLPPVMGDAQALRREKDQKSAVDISFNVFDNRPGTIALTISRPLYGTSEKDGVRIVSGGQSVPAGRFSVALPALPAAVKGKDVIVVTATDADGNSSSLQFKVDYNEPMDDNFGNN